MIKLKIKKISNIFSKKSIEKMDVLVEIQGEFFFSVLKNHGIHHGWFIYTIKINGTNATQKVKTKFEISRYY